MLNEYDKYFKSNDEWDAKKEWKITTKIELAIYDLMMNNKKATMLEIIKKTKMPKSDVIRHIKQLEFFGVIVPEYFRTHYEFKRHYIISNVSLPFIIRIKQLSRRKKCRKKQK